VHVFENHVILHFYLDHLLSSCMMRVLKYSLQSLRSIPAGFFYAMRVEFCLTGD